MANEKNLRPLNTIDPEEARLIRQKGGKERVRRARFAKDFREAFMKAVDKQIIVKGKKTTPREQLAEAAIAEGMSGNVKAIELIIKALGEALVERHELTGADGKDLFANKTDDELKSTLNELMNKLGKC